MTKIDEMTDAELADYYNRTQDVSEFEGGEVIVPPATKETRNLTISVRFSPTEMADLEAQAAAAGMPLTTYIRRTALASKEPPIDRDEVLDLLTLLRRKVEPAKRTRARTTKKAAG